MAITPSSSSSKSAIWHSRRAGFVEIGMTPDTCVDSERWLPFSSRRGRRLGCGPAATREVGDTGADEVVTCKDECEDLWTRGLVRLGPRELDNSWFYNNGLG